MELPLEIIDSIVLVREIDESKILAEWSLYDPEITFITDFMANQGVKMYVNWSDKNGTIPLQQGDYFTLLIPDIFMQNMVSEVTDVPITNESSEVVATYSIYSNDDGQKEVKITFTDYVNTHTEVSGDFWVLLFVGLVTSTGTKTLEFTINGEIVVSSDVTVTPASYTPANKKYGRSDFNRKVGGYYLFEWRVLFNMNENAETGFNQYENFSFVDSLPANSPHIFLTDEIRQELGVDPTSYLPQIGEYRGADSQPAISRYQLFLSQFIANTWYNQINWSILADGLTSVGIDGGEGLNVSNLVTTDKAVSVNLGTITRPTLLKLYTVSTVKLAESALGDTEVVKLFQNVFDASVGQDFNVALEMYRFESGGTAQGISGEYSFSFTKVDEEGVILPGALFTLYLTDDLLIEADRFMFSDNNGVVLFEKLPLGTYFLVEEATPLGYLPNNTVYQVDLTATGFQIYSGPDFVTPLPNNQITNVLESGQPILVPLSGTKSLSGRSMMNGMFHFTVTDESGTTVATGLNDTGGNIVFDEIEIDAAGVYDFTIEESRGSYSGITYDTNQFTARVTVEEDENGNLSYDVTYPNGEIAFSNTFSESLASIELIAQKNLTGKDLTEDQFTFIVKDQLEQIVASGTNDADGVIRFTPIGFDTEDVYEFIVEETSGSEGGIQYDSTQFRVIVTVEEIEGTLTADATYPDGDLVFNNHYSARPVYVTLVARKRLIGSYLSSEMFQFVVRNEAEEVVATASNNAYGDIHFTGIEFDTVGIYHLIVEEMVDTIEDITYDTTRFTVTVTVTDNGNGRLVADIVYPERGITFNNHYSGKCELPCKCQDQKTNCRTSITGKKVWIDSGNIGNTRPATVEIVLLRDEEVYKHLDLDAKGDGQFAFCCLPVWRNRKDKYVYRIEELNVPIGYIKTIEGSTITNTLDD